jgi:hypothetical protein
MEYLANGYTGLYEVDMFLAAYNPSKSRRRARVWSPDMDYTRRPTIGGP